MHTKWANTSHFGALQSRDFVQGSTKRLAQAGFRIFTVNLRMEYAWEVGEGRSYILPSLRFGLHGCMFYVPGGLDCERRG